MTVTDRPGSHDDRAVATHSLKLIAELQHRLRDNPNPLLLRCDVKAGHGPGKSTAQSINEAVDVCESCILAFQSAAVTRDACRGVRGAGAATEMARLNAGRSSACTCNAPTSPLQSGTHRMLDAQCGQDDRKAHNAASARRPERGTCLVTSVFGHMSRLDCQQQRLDNCFWVMT